MTQLSRGAWIQLRNKSIQDIQRALLRDGWEEEVTIGATIPYRHPTKSPPNNRVVLHMHPKATKGPKLLKSLFDTIGWTEEDLLRLRLIKLPGKKRTK